MFVGEKVRALFFDMDGTLINTLPSLYEAYCDVKRQLGQTPNPLEFQQLNGATADQIAVTLQSIDKSKDQIANQLTAARNKYLPRNAHLFEGAREFLALCKEKNFSLWLVTSASRSYADQMLQHCKIHSLFCELITSEDIRFSKPHPEIYLKALERAQVSPDEALVFEDSAQGITSALKAGLHVVSFNSDHATPSDLHNSLNLLEKFSQWSDIKKWFFNLRV